MIQNATLNISDLASSLSAYTSADAIGQTARTRASSGSDAISKALGQATERLSQQRESAQVRLSAFGQIKSAVAELQSSSKALTDATNTDTAEEATKTAQNFVSAFNTARTVANRAINGDGETEGALATDSRARVAANEVNRSLDRSSSKALSAIGITTNQDGTLSLDKQKFEQALQSAPQQVSDTLSAAGQQVEQSTSRQLQNTSNVNRSISTLNTQVRNLESQQANQQNLIELMQRSTEQANNRLNAISASGIASYQKIFNL